MEKRISFYLLSTSIVMIITAIGFRLFHLMTPGRDFSCIAVQTTRHGNFTMIGRYDFLFRKGEGRIRINGSTIVSSNKNIVSRQVFFSFIRHGSDFVLKSKQIQLMNNGDNETANVDFNKHFPAFFSQEGRLLALAIRQENRINFVIYFADVPAFYCQRKM